MGFPDTPRHAFSPTGLIVFARYRLRLMNVPFSYSSNAILSTSRVIMTMGLQQATDSQLSPQFGDGFMAQGAIPNDRIIPLWRTIQWGYSGSHAVSLRSQLFPIGLQRSFQGFYP
jgi:hypothetical protein